jgi:hypothetical protein
MNEDITNQDLLNAIKKYQSCPFVHELTCANDSQNHEPLKGIEIKGRVVLICPDCEYTQTHIPKIVWTATDIEDAMEYQFPTKEY